MVLSGELAASPPVQPLEQRRPMRWDQRVKAGPDPLIELAQVAVVPSEMPVQPAAVGQLVQLHYLAPTRGLRAEQHEGKQMFTVGYPLWGRSRRVASSQRSMSWRR